MTRIAYAGLAAAAVFMAGCDGLKEAMSAHADVVARAESQKLPVDRLAKLMVSNSQIPLQPDVARVVANVWMDYQLLGLAAARNDSLNAPKLVDQALWMEIGQLRTKLLHDSITKTFKLPDTAAVNEAQYQQGDLLAAAHILFLIPDSATPKQVDSVRKKAEGVRAQATEKNFGQLAEKYSDDPGSKTRGGSLGVFPKDGPGGMVVEFQKGVVALKPGEISPLVRTQFGFHIIRRLPYAEVRSEYVEALMQNASRIADSLYLSKLETDGKVQIKPKAPEIVKAVAADLEGHRNDKTVVATSVAGSLTAGRVDQWIRSYPSQAQLTGQIAQAPDSLLNNFMRQLVRQDLVLHEADRMKIVPPAGQLDTIRRGFSDMVVATWRQLGIDPKSLADSAKTQADREKLAASRVDDYVNALVGGQAQYVQISDQLETVLHQKYSGKIIDAGLARAVENAGKLRADSAHNAPPPPPSDVPMPGGAGSPPPSGGAAPPPSGGTKPATPPPSGQKPPAGTATKPPPSDQR